MFEVTDQDKPGKDQPDAAFRKIEPVVGRVEPVIVRRLIPPPDSTKHVIDEDIHTETVSGFETATLSAE